MYVCIAYGVCKHLCSAYCVLVNGELYWFRGSCTLVESSGITVRCRCSDQGFFAVLTSSVHTVIHVIDDHNEQNHVYKQVINVFL